MHVPTWRLALRIWLFIGEWSGGYSGSGLIRSMGGNQLIYENPMDYNN